MLVAKQGRPLRESQLRGDDGAAFAMALLDEIEEEPCHSLLQWGVSELIDEQAIPAGKVLDDSSIGVICKGLVESGGEVFEVDESGTALMVDSMDQECGSKAGFPAACRSDEEQHLGFSDEA
jgi:hypothetical protein